MWTVLIIIVVIVGIFVIIHYATLTELDKESIESVGGTEHISGVPGLPKGVSCSVRVGKERIIINNQQIIPMERVISSNIIRSRDLVEKDGNIVGNAILGGVLFGGVGALLGGMSGARTNVVSENVDLLTINYKNKEGEKSQIILMATDPLTKEFAKNVSKEINKLVGYVPEVSPDEMYEI